MHSHSYSHEKGTPARTGVRNPHACTPAPTPTPTRIRTRTRTCGDKSTEALVRAAGNDMGEFAAKVVEI
eukprot:4304388-Pleurochrysis_carterae.AAC.1